MSKSLEALVEKSLNKHRNRNELECMKQATEKVEALEKDLAATNATMNEMEIEAESDRQRFERERCQAVQLWEKERADHVAKQLYLTEQINELQAWKLQFSTAIGQSRPSEEATGSHSIAVGGNTFSQGPTTGMHGGFVGAGCEPEKTQMEELLEKVHKGTFGGPVWHLLRAVEHLAAETQIRLSKLEQAFDLSTTDSHQAQVDVNDALVNCEAATTSLRRELARGFSDLQPILCDALESLMKSIRAVVSVEVEEEDDRG